MQLAARPRITAGAQQETTRRLATAGVALAGASLIAVAPGIPVLPDVQQEARASAVRLTAGWDPLTPWKDAFNTTSANASTLVNNFFLAPFVGLQQAIVNQAGYLDTVLNDPSSIDTVVQQFANNAKTVASALALLNASDDTRTAVLAHTTDVLHGAILSLLPAFLPPDVNADAVGLVLNFLASPLSGLLIGAVGPVISPGVALLNSLQAAGQAINDRDMTAALSDLLDAPAHVVNAFFNGADLDLSALTPLINNSGVLGSTTIDALSFSFGGLFSVGSVSQGTYNPTGDPADAITTPGGSILNSLGLTVTTDALGVPLTLAIPGHAVGPLAALESLSQTIGVLLGDGWDGKSGKPVPPLAGLHFPTLSDTEDDPSLTDLSATVQRLVAHAQPATDDAVTNDVAVAKVPSASTKTVTLDVDSPVAAAENVSTPSADAPSLEGSTTTGSDIAAAQNVSTPTEQTSDTKESTPSADAPSLGGSTTTVKDSPKAVGGKTGTPSNASHGFKGTVKNILGRHNVGGHNGRGWTGTGSTTSSSSSTGSSSGSSAPGGASSGTSAESAGDK